MSSTVTSDVQAIVGSDRVRPAAPDDAVRGVRPQVVVEPGTAAEVASVLKVANDQGLAVIPRGGGTKLAWGNPPRRADLVLSTRRLGQIVEHPWADLTVTVEAGCTIRALQEALARHGQRVAADPLWPDAATVGGVLSTNDTGALRLRFGGWRDLVIGTTIALPDGTVARSGGKVVKNVAGYDLSKLATGAFGTLGVITTAIFRLHPLPKVVRTLSAAMPDAAAIQRAMAALQDSVLAHTSLQVCASGSATPSVDILFEGTAAGVDAQVQDARALLGSVSLHDGDPRVWAASQDLWTAGGEGPIVRVSVPFTEIAGTLEIVNRLAGAARGSWQAVFQATGLGWVRFTGVEDWPALVRALRAAVDAQQGSVIIVRQASIGESCDAWGDAGDAVPLMMAVKQQLDSKSTLNPGRFVGGI